MATTLLRALRSFSRLCWVVCSRARPGRFIPPHRLDDPRNPLKCYTMSRSKAEGWCRAVREIDLWVRQENTIDGLTEGQMADLIAESTMYSTDPDTERLYRLRSHRPPTKNTRPERALQAALRRCRVQFRLHDWRLPGHPDIVIPRSRLAVFVDGDYWHGRHPTKIHPAHRSSIRQPKERDARKTRALWFRGWSVMRFWGSQVMATPDRCAEEIVRRVNQRRQLLASSNRQGRPRPHTTPTEAKANDGRRIGLSRKVSRV